MQEGSAKAFADKMRREGLPEVAIEAFVRGFEFVRSGASTTIPEAQIEAAEGLPGLAELDEFEAAGKAAAGRAVVVKLNGGLGTSMGLSKAKSLLPVRKDVRFLDLIARQVIAQRAAWKSPLPLVLMNSYRTREDSLAALASHRELACESLALDFVQHKVPRIALSDGSPVAWSDDASLEWCPPGHGDLYIAMKSSGMLDALRGRGLRYAFVSNADNLGAVLDPRILGWMASRGLPFVMEVAERTESDRKGGHLARKDGQWVLREVAQCPKEDLASFQDISRHRYFNTNNLWLDLDALAEALEATPGGLPLPVISNEKNVSSQDEGSPRCLQLESAMGSAIECFDGAEAIVVPRARFAPVKTTNDLLALWSDAYVVTEDARVVARDAEAERARVVDLDPRYFGKIDALFERFPSGAPSLAKCRRFTILGDYTFGADVVVEGDVRLVNESGETIRIPDGTVLGSD